MNFWTPMTGKIGDGWQYTYDAHQIRGFKQTHQPLPWINDYGQFAIMPVTGKTGIRPGRTQAGSPHKGEAATPYYYKVYLADYDVVTEMTPTERAAIFRFTFPEDSSYVVVDAPSTAGSSVTIVPEENTRLWDTPHATAAECPTTLGTYFVIKFDKPFTYTATFSNNGLKPANQDTPAKLATDTSAK